MPLLSERDNMSVVRRQGLVEVGENGAEEGGAELRAAGGSAFDWPVPSSFAIGNYFSTSPGTMARVVCRGVLSCESNRS